MLIEIKVNHFAIIDQLHLQFRDGLNILSGETGSGKSVLLKSLALLMGGKASSDTVRTGSQQALVEGSFDLKTRLDVKARLTEMGIDIEDDRLVVRRIISADEKSKIYLNGSLSTLQNLRDIVAPLIEVTGHNVPLIEMTGQHDNRHLMSKAYHLDLIDQYVGNSEKRLLFEEKYQKMVSLKNEILALQGQSQTLHQRLDYLEYQRKEITDLDLSPGEDMELENKVKRLKNATRLIQFVESAESVLENDEGSVVERIKTILRKGHELSSLDPQLPEKLKSLEQAQSLISDTLFELGQYLKSVDVDPSELEQLESRLSDLRKIQKKFGPSVDHILKSLLEIEIEISNLQKSEQSLEGYKKEVVALETELFKIAEELHKKRSKGAPLLSDSVNSELEELNMKGVIFHAKVEKLNDLGPSGISDVEFLSQTSPKDPARPLSKFASGGELSRILLSLKRVVGSQQFPRTYLFDEVDTGVSGPTAEKVGKKLRSIAKGQQVICVTHLPQVAAFGDSHFLIQKIQKKDRVNMEVVDLSFDERVDEIARLISGEKITKTSKAHAVELLKACES
jgi:DNA repair protein RecN (Recombination protein N)